MAEDTRIWRSQEDISRIAELEADLARVREARERAERLCAEHVPDECAAHYRRVMKERDQALARAEKAERAVAELDKKNAASIERAEKAEARVAYVKELENARGALLRRAEKAEAERDGHYETAIRLQNRACDLAGDLADAVEALGKMVPAVEELIHMYRALVDEVERYFNTPTEGERDPEGNADLLAALQERQRELEEWCEGIEPYRALLDRLGGK